MTKSSCIEHLPNQQLVIIREDYVALCEESASADPAVDPNCAAALLNLFEYFTNWKKANSQQAKKYNDTSESGGQERNQDESLWIWKTTDELQSDLMNIWGKTKIETARKWLVSKGFIQQRRNPHHNWDKTYQYFYDIEGVNSSLQSLKNKEAIPEVTSKIKDKKNVDPLGQQARASREPNHPANDTTHPDFNLFGKTWQCPKCNSLDVGHEPLECLNCEYTLPSELLQNMQQLPDSDDPDTDLIDRSPLTPDEIAMGLELAKEHGLDGDWIDEPVPTKPIESFQIKGKIKEVRKGQPSSSGMLGIDDLDDGNDPFANKNESGESVPIMPDNPTDNPNLSQLSQEQSWILHTLARTDVDYLYHHRLSGAIGPMMKNMIAQKYIKQAGAKTNGYWIAPKGKQWVADNPEAIQKQPDKLMIELKGGKQKGKRNGKKKTVYATIQPLYDALNRYWGGTETSLTKTEHDNRVSVARELFNANATPDEVAALYQYAEKNFPTHTVRICTAHLSKVRKQDTPQNNPEYQDDGIQNAIDPNALTPGG